VSYADPTREVEQLNQQYHGIFIPASYMIYHQTFGDAGCHPERSERSGSMDAELLRCAQGDSQHSSQVRSREVFSPNV